MDIPADNDDGHLHVDSVTGVPLDLAIAGPGGRSFAFVIDFHIRALVAIAWYFGGWLLLQAIPRGRPRTAALAVRPRRAAADRLLPSLSPGPRDRDGRPHAGQAHGGRAHRHGRGHGPRRRRDRGAEPVPLRGRPADHVPRRPRDDDRRRAATSASATWPPARS